MFLRRAFFHLSGKRDSHRCPFPVFFEYVNACSCAVDTPCLSFRPATPLSAFRQVLPLGSERWSVERRRHVWPWLWLVQRLKVCFLLLLFWEPIQRHCFGFFFSFPFVAPFSSQEKKTAQRLTLFRPRPKKRWPPLCEFIVGGAEGGRAVAPLFGAPSSMKLWTWRVFISLCGLICLSEGSVPRCGLAPTLLSVRALDSSDGGGTEQSGT